MKSKNDKTDPEPPVALQLELQNLRKSFGPLAFDVAVEQLQSTRGRRRERSTDTILAVRLLIDIYRRTTDARISDATRYAAKHWIINDMKGFVGAMSSSRDVIKRLSYPHQTWRRLYYKAGEILATDPEKKRWYDLATGATRGSEHFL